MKRKMLDAIIKELDEYGLYYDYDDILNVVSAYKKVKRKTKPKKTKEEPQIISVNYTIT